MKFDLSKHSLKVLHHEGVYRHLQCQVGDDYHMRFFITTWPNYLAITGDMGTFVFVRTHDMFELFRGVVNPSYWTEKLCAIDDSKGAMLKARREFACHAIHWAVCEYDKLTL